ncbi:unnamed protein product [Meloidogyne enterolobii]|uniref:Uncharacterized protein n=1 Tax=Meloidogyne enterolobii TaxID=390850 RepID=A0ACB1AI16_MELEN
MSKKRRKGEGRLVAPVGGGLDFLSPLSPHFFFLNIFSSPLFSSKKSPLSNNGANGQTA